MLFVAVTSCAQQPAQRVGTHSPNLVIVFVVRRGRHPQPANLAVAQEDSGETRGLTGKQRQDIVSDETERRGAPGGEAAVGN